MTTLSCELLSHLYSATGDYFLFPNLKKLGSNDEIIAQLLVFLVLIKFHHLVAINKLEKRWTR